MNDLIELSSGEIWLEYGDMEDPFSPVNLAVLVTFLLLVAWAFWDGVIKGRE